MSSATLPLRGSYPNMGMPFVEHSERRDDTIFHHGGERERKRASKRDGRSTTDPSARLASSADSRIRRFQPSYFPPFVTAKCQERTMRGERDGSVRTAVYMYIHIICIRVSIETDRRSSERPKRSRSLCATNLEERRVDTRHTCVVARTTRRGVKINLRTGNESPRLADGGRWRWPGCEIGRAHV